MSEVVVVPVDEHLLRAIALAEHDCDVAAGLRVDGVLLDQLEALDRRLAREVAEAVLGVGGGA